MSKGRARLEMSQGVSVWLLDAPDGFGDADVHAHHAIQITASLTGALSLTSAAGTLTAPILAVAADARHRFEAHGLLAFIFVEPESRLGRGLTESLFGGRDLVAVENPAIARHLEPLRAAFDAPPDKGALIAAGQKVAGELAPGVRARLPDPRVQRIIDYAASHLEEPLSLAGASAGVHLSPSRLRHLFVEQTGLAFKTHLLWLRLVRAVRSIRKGGPSPKPLMRPAFPIPRISAGSSSAPSGCRRRP